MSLLAPHCIHPKWRQATRNTIPVTPQELTWLLDDGSLTQKLVALSAGDFRVEVLRQSIRKVPFSERMALHIPLNQWAVIREVILYGQGQAWVYAHTVIPLTTLHGPLRRLHYLGNKSLGEQLFTDPTMKRGAIEIAQLSPQSLPELLALTSPVWGRRSVFRLSEKPLLVSEIFLPELLNHTLNQ